MNGRSAVLVLCKWRQLPKLLASISPKCFSKGQRVAEILLPSPQPRGRRTLPRGSRKVAPRQLTIRLLSPGWPGRHQSIHPSGPTAPYGTEGPFFPTPAYSPHCRRAPWSWQTPLLAAGDTRARPALSAGLRTQQRLQPAPPANYSSAFLSLQQGSAA